MNIGDIVRRVQNQLGDEAGVVIERGDILDYVNDAQTDISRRTDILRTTTTIPVVAGTEAYSLPITFISSKRVTWDGVALQSIAPEEIDVLDPNKDVASTTSSGPPSYFWITGNSIHLYPIPNATAPSSLKVTHSKTPTVLVADTDEPDIPVHMHEDLVRYAIARSREQIEDYQAAVSVMAEYEKRVASSSEQAQNQESDSYPAVRDIEAGHNYGYGW